jgi:hypothetical protein
VADRVRLGRAMVQRLLDFILVPSDIPDELVSAVNLLMLPMLRSMCVPSGQDLTGLEAVIAAHDRAEPDSFYPRIIAGQITSDIAALQEWGLVAVSAGRATIPVGLRPAVVDTINSPLAPFIVTAKPDAVPIPDPDFHHS